MPRTADRPPSSSRRADAERNRGKILAAARAAFAEPGAEVSMAEISRRAGVGMATLYRNFPGRRELLETLYADKIDDLCDAAERAPGATPSARFEAWLQQFFVFVTSKRAIAAELLASSDSVSPLFGEGRARVLVAGRPLLEAAQRASEVRGDLTLEQITDMVVAIAKIPGDSRHLRPMIQATLDGLKSPRTEHEGP